MRSTLLNVPLQTQRNLSDCLPVCVEMVLRFYGANVDPAWLCATLECTAIGTPGFNVRNLERFGYRVEYGAASDARVLAHALSNRTPPILLVNTDSLPYWRIGTAHAVVLVDMDDETACVNDPAFADIQNISINHLLLAWSDFDQLYAIISAPTGVASLSLPGLPQR